LIPPAARTDDLGVQPNHPANSLLHHRPEEALNLPSRADRAIQQVFDLLDA
jgi:hypothetical protein